MMFNRLFWLVLLTVCMSQSTLAEPLGAGFTYQGQLVQGGSAVSGVCDFNFGLWDASTSGAQVATAVDALNVTVNEGVLNTVLDFGASAFDGNVRWLEIAVVCPAASGALTTLAPRQELAATPYSLYAMNVSSAVLSDLDGDGVPNAVDNCPFTANAEQDDADGDGVGDTCDNCPSDFNPWNIDVDGDGIGDECDNEDRTCEPVAQTGCDPGEKCTFVRDVENPADSRTFCRPDGAVQSGNVCTSDPVTGLDNCAAGLFCAGGTCAEICSMAPDSCSSSFSCALLPGLVDSPGVGYCQVVCDPLSDPSGCPGGEACYILVSQETSACATPATTDTQGVACNFINSCASGYSCSLTNSPVDPTGLDCAFICDASQGGGPTCAQGSEPSYTCVQINQFYPNVEGLPDAYGMCVDPVEWDEDGDGVLD